MPTSRETVVDSHDEDEDEDSRGDRDLFPVVAPHLEQPLLLPHSRKRLVPLAVPRRPGRSSRRSCSSCSILTRGRRGRRRGGCANQSDSRATSLSARGAVPQLVLPGGVRFGGGRVSS